MRRKIFYLSTCTTCNRIIKGLGGLECFDFQDIKEKNISPGVLDELASEVGSYEALFSRRAMKFRAWRLHEKKLTEEDYRRYILQEYTFLKRPVIIIDNVITVGSSKKEIARAKDALGI